MSSNEEIFHYWESFWHSWTTQIATRGTYSRKIKSHSLPKKPKSNTLQLEVKSVVMGG